MTQNTLKVIYITGWGRSGSTLLARILGQIEGIAHFGELRTIWTDGFKSKSICGCGSPTHECEVWQSIMDEAFGGLENVDLSSMVNLRRASEPRTAELFKLRFSQQRRDLFLQKSMQYRDVLQKLYSSIQKTSKVNAVIDDSLHPGYAYTLSHVPNIQPFIVHLVRDSRGCAYSWTKRRKKGLGYYTLKDSSLGWNMRNLATAMLKDFNGLNYCCIRYEDFIKSPQDTISEILRFSDINPVNLPFSDSSTVTLKPTHSIFGNDNRVETGSISLREDETWKSKMTVSDRLKVTTLTWPVLLKYRYLF